MDEAPTPADTSVISVRGEATLVVDPEIADIFISFFAQARDRREAFERLVKRNDEVLSLVRSYGDAIEHFASGGLSVVPELRRGRDEKIRSYRGSAQVNATVADFSVLGELIARLSELETVTLNGPFWRLRQTSPVYRDARTQAVSEALARARDYAAAIGCRVVGLIELSDTGMSAPMMRAARPRMVPMAAPTGGAAPGAPEPPMLDLEPQQQTVHANVEARFHATQPDLAPPAEG
ncbi:MAG TPA: SIMPL domain-containing protein [Thermoleophilia bacterium]|jgi:uncharacterized protein YggE|nr:SIMPL domain-containing protein [Thermoleophilia bacterium]